MHKLLSHLSDRSSFRGLIFSIVCMVTMSGVPELSAQRVELEYREYGTDKYYGNILAGSGSSIVTQFYENKRKLIDQARRIENELAIKPITLQVAFHCLYTDDMKVCQQAVASQLDALNRDFNGKAHTDKYANDPEGIYSKLASSAQISFVAAKTVQSEKYGDGIVSIGKTTAEWREWDDIKIADKGGSSGISQSTVINIWIADMPDRFKSFSTSPFLTNEADGIVINARYFGQQDGREHPYHMGKTLTHLIGRYLGLDPLWGTEGYCSDDGVEDTPVHNGPNYEYEYKHVSGCRPHDIEMLHNFMDSTPDASVHYFTQGQVKRIHALMAITRSRLLSTTNSKL